MAVQEQFIANKSLLECRTHEVVTRPGIRENREMDPEKRKVYNRRDNNESDGSSSKMSSKVFLLKNHGYACDTCSRFLPLNDPF